MKFACDYDCCDFVDPQDESDRECECCDCYLCGGKLAPGEKLDMGDE